MVAHRSSHDFCSLLQCIERHMIVFDPLKKKKNSVFIASNVGLVCYKYNLLKIHIIWLFFFYIKTNQFYKSFRPSFNTIQRGCTSQQLRHQWRERTKQRSLDVPSSNPISSSPYHIHKHATLQTLYLIFIHYQNPTAEALYSYIYIW